ncbi:MAG: tetratricopeptide repeat protein [Bacteroidota bacterium]
MASTNLSAQNSTSLEGLWAINNDAFELIQAGKDYTKASHMLDSTLQLALKRDYPHLASDCYSQKSTIAQRQNELVEALEFAQKALSLRKILDLTGNVGDSHNNLGIIHKKLGNLDSAVFHFQKGLDIWQDIEDDKVAAYIQINLSDALFQKGELDKALENSLNSLSVMHELEEQAGVAYNRLSLGNIYLELGAYDSAESQLQDLLTYAKEVNNIPLLIKAEVALIGLWGEMGKKDEALTIGEEAFKAFNKKIDQYQIEYEDFTKLMNQLGTIHEKQKDFTKAEQYYKQAVALSRAQSSRSAVLAYINLGELYLETKQFKSAQISLSESLEKVANTQQNDLHRRVLDDLAFLNAQLGDYDQAYQYSQAEDSLVEMINGSLRRAEASHFDTNLKLYEQAAAAKRKILVRNFILVFVLFTLIVGVIFYLQKTKETKQKSEAEKQRILAAYKESEVEAQKVEIAKQKAEAERQKAEAEKQKAEVQYQKLQIENLIESNKADSILAMLKGQKEERGRISLALHNDVGALFTLAKHPFKQGFGALNQEVWQNLEENLSQIQEKVRAISHENGQTVLAKRYFADAVQELCQKTSQYSNIAVEPVFDFNAEKLGLDTRVKLYSLISELLNNAVKHSGAKNIEINITEVDDLLNLMVIDDGVGFDTADKEFEGKGVKIIHTITNSLGGSCEYDSQLGRGTTVNIEIPV